MLKEEGIWIQLQATELERLLLFSSNGQKTIDQIINELRQKASQNATRQTDSNRKEALSNKLTDGGIGLNDKPMTCEILATQVLQAIRRFYVLEAIKLI